MRLKLASERVIGSNPIASTTKKTKKYKNFGFIIVKAILELANVGERSNPENSRFSPYRYAGSNPAVSISLEVFERVLTAHPYSSVEERLPSKQ